MSAVVPDPRYPIGKLVQPETITPADRLHAIQSIAELPAKLRRAVEGLNASQIDTPYREGGWTVRQLVHHIADSHAMALVRVRCALTEDWPEIMLYSQKEWAMLPDSAAPIDMSLSLIEGLHARWATLLRALTEEQWKRGFKHPQNGPTPVERATLTYAWHGLHHVAHITRLREARRW